MIRTSRSCSVFWLVGLLSLSSDDYQPRACLSGLTFPELSCSQWTDRGEDGGRRNSSRRRGSEITAQNPIDLSASSMVAVLVAERLARTKHPRIHRPLNLAANQVLFSFSFLFFFFFPIFVSKLSSHFEQRGEKWTRSDIRTSTVSCE